MIQLATRPAYLARLFADNGLVELRHHAAGRWVTGWFDDAARMEREIQQRAHVGDLYTSLNAPKPRRASNTMVGEPITNDAVGWITRIPFDFDPVRPSGVASTADELAAANVRRDALVAMLRKVGWALPLHALSGNGYHAVYRCRLPNSDETRDQLGAIYHGLHAEYSDDEVQFDRSVRNPGRIFRLYGTWNRKGSDTPDRPHRLAACWIPSPWRQVDARQIERLATRYARRSETRATVSIDRSLSGFQATGRGDYRTLDVVAWTRAHGLYRRHVEGNAHSIWCPWREGHSTPHGATGAVVFDNGLGKWPGFHCHHASCAGRGIADLIAKLGDADQFCRDVFQGGRTA